MKLRHFTSYISVDGVPLPEFATELSVDGKEAACWIPSEDNKRFRVVFKNAASSPHVRVSASVSVDGIACGGRSLHVGGDSSITSGHRDSVSVSKDTRRALVFGKQALTDDDAYLDTPISPDMGCIRVEFRHVKEYGPKTGERKETRFTTQVLHERSKKALGHSVRFGADYKAMNRRTRVETISTLVTFTFRYRPIEPGILRAEGIAPAEIVQQPASPEPSENEVETAAEIEQLEVRLKALRERSKKGKPSTRVKQEIKKEESVFHSGEIIDLT